MSQPIVFERLDALGVRVKSIEDSGGGGGGTVTIPVGSQTQAGILRLSLDSEVTAEQHGLAATASQVFGAKNSAAIANSGVSTVTGNVTALTTRVVGVEVDLAGLDYRVTDLESSNAGLDAALAAFLRI